MPETFSQRISAIQARTERIKGWGAIIAIIATNTVTLVTAVTAHMKEEKEETAKASYKELSSAIKRVSEEQVRLGHDLANIRGYLEGQSKQPVRIIEGDTRTTEEIFDDFIARRRAELKGKKPPKRGASGKIPREFVAVPGQDPPPEIHAAPKPYDPPDIDALRKK